MNHPVKPIMDLWAAFYRLDAALVVDDRFGISTRMTFRDYLYLVMIDSNEECTVSKLAAMTRVSKPSVTARVDGLVERGLVTRTRSEDDKRVVRLELTERAAESVNREREVISYLLDGLAEEHGEDSVREFLVMADELASKIWEFGDNGGDDIPKHRHPREASGAHHRRHAAQVRCRRHGGSCEGHSACHQRGIGSVQEAQPPGGPGEDGGRRPRHTGGARGSGRVHRRADHRSRGHRHRQDEDERLLRDPSGAGAEEQGRRRGSRMRAGVQMVRARHLLRRLRGGPVPVSAEGGIGILRSRSHRPCGGPVQDRGHGRSPRESRSGRASPF